MVDETAIQVWDRHLPAWKKEGEVSFCLQAPSRSRFSGPALHPSCAQRKAPAIPSKKWGPQSRCQYSRGTLAFRLGLELLRYCGQPRWSLLDQLLDCC